MDTPQVGDVWELDDEDHEVVSVSQFAVQAMSLVDFQTATIDIHEFKQVAKLIQRNGEAVQS